MASVPLRAADGSGKGTADLPDEVFAVQVNVPVMHRVVRAQRAAARAGTHSTKTRAEVRGGGRKPWRQKGTGRSRQGSTRAPQWTGGGVVFGPVPRDHSMRVNKKEKQLALRSALSDRHALGAVHVIDALDFNAPSTRRAAELLAALDLGDARVLLVVGDEPSAATKSFRNLPLVALLPHHQLNTYDVLLSDAVVFTRGALDAFVGRGAPAGTRPGEVEDDELVLESPAPSGRAQPRDATEQEGTA